MDRLKHKNIHSKLLSSGVTLPQCVTGMSYSRLHGGKKVNMFVSWTKQYLPLQSVLG